jgi:hypothetical protein
VQSQQDPTFTQQPLTCFSSAAAPCLQIMYNSRKMHKPKDKWRSREYGFIDYASPEEAAKAIVWMDGVELPDLMKDTCGIIVQYAKPTGSSSEQNATGPAAGS